MESVPPNQDATRQFARLVDELERRLVPTAGFGWGERVYLPDPGDQSQTLKLAVLAHAFRTLEAAKACLGGRARSGLSAFADGDTDALDAHLHSDPEREIYIRLMDLCNEICAHCHAWPEVCDPTGEVRQGLVALHSAQLLQGMETDPWVAGGLTALIERAGADFDAYGDHAAALYSELAQQVHDGLTLRGWSQAHASAVVSEIQRRWIARRLGSDDAGSARR